MPVYVNQTDNLYWWIGLLYKISYYLSVSILFCFVYDLHHTIYIYEGNECELESWVLQWQASSPPSTQFFPCRRVWLS